MAVRRGMCWARLWAHGTCVWVALALLAALPAVAAAAQDGGNGQRWQFSAADLIFATATSADGALTVVGSRDSTAYVLDRGGTVVWKYTTANAVTAVAVAPDASYVAVASGDSTLTLLDHGGHVVWKQTESGPLGAVALTQGAARVAYGVNNTAALNKDQNLYLLDHAGHQLWKAPLGGSPLAVAITPDGSRVVAGADDASVSVFDGTGKQLWQQGADDLIDGVAISGDGVVVAGSEDHHVYRYSAAGKQVWTYTTGDKVHAVAISADASRVAAASEDGSIYLLNDKGGVILRNTTGQIGYAVALSADAHVLVIGLGNNRASAYDIAGELAGSAASQQAFYLRVAAGVAVLVLALALYGLYLRRSPRGRAAAGRRMAQVQRGGNRLWHARLSYVLLIPTFALLLVFNYYPALSGLYHSLTAWHPGIRTDFVGLANFQAMLTDRYLTIGIVNLLILLVAGVVKTVSVPLIVAELIFHLRSKAAQYWARTAFVLPTVVPAVAGILLWRFIYDPNLGLANQFLRSIGLSSWTHSWLGEPRYALGAIIFIGFPWVGVFPLLVLYAGLIGISGETLEAATVDGAGALRRIWSIHIPLLAGQFKLLLILTFIGGIQDFTGIFILTEGGPLDSTYVPGLELYFNATRFDNLGYASAIGVVLFAVIMVVTIVQMRFLRSSTES